MIKSLVFVGIGGGIGSILRYLTSCLIAKYSHSLFPVATLIVNLLGCFLIGLLLGLSVRRDLLDEQMRFLFITGFCGGFTTFSAFSAENIALLESGHYFILSGYILASVIGGMAAVWAGYRLQSIILI